MTERPNGDPATARWHFDKRIPVAVLAFLGLQAVGLIIWGVSLSAQTNRNTDRIEKIEERMQGDLAVLDRLARVETEVRMTREAMDRIERRLDRREDEAGP